MPKYYPFKIADHYLYFTEECIVEAMHVHASDKEVDRSSFCKILCESRRKLCHAETR